MTMNNHIEGIFRLRTPLHCASPDDSLANKPAETPTVQMRIVTANGERRIPFFPGNDLRGRLRRKAAKIVLDHICATAQVSPQLYAGLCAGAVSAQPESDLSIEEALRAGRNVYMGLFGGGTRLIRSLYSCQDLVPVLRETVDIGMVPAQYVENDGKNFLPSRMTSEGEKALEGWNLVQNRQIIRVDDVLRVTNPEDMQAYIADVVETVSALQNETVGQRQRRKISKAQAEAGQIKQSEVEKKTDLGNMPSFQYIAAGTPMYFRLDFFDEISDAQVGLMLLALRDLVAEQRLGGWVRAGLGRFGAELSLTRDGERMPVFAASPAVEDAVLSDAVMGQFVAAAREEIGALTADGLMAFFEPRKAEAGASA